MNYAIVYTVSQRQSPPPPLEGEVTKSIPEFTVRVILLYSRSNCPLSWDNKEVS